MRPRTRSRAVPQPEKHGQFRRFFSNLGPGLITGAADDDPSGISTYSVAGATFGYLPLWTALFSFPLMTAVQLMCARLGLVTGLGLAGVIRRRYSRWVLWGACALLVIANVINIAADLGGMAEATMMVTGAPVALMVPVFGVVIVVAVDVVVLPHDRPRVQVADARAPRLRRHRIRRARRLAARAPGDGHSAHGMVARVLLRPGRDPWHDDLSVSVFLAGGAGSRRRARHGPQSGAPPRRDARGTQRLPHGRHHRHVRLECDHVLHHHDDGGHAPRAWQDEHRHRARGRRGACVRWPAPAPTGCLRWD